MILEGTLESFIPVLIGAFVGVVLVVFTINFIWQILTTKKPNPAKYEVYECGEITIGDSQQNTNIDVKYYTYALMFLVFDVEAVFLFPWAVNFKLLGLTGFIEVILFILLILTALIYAINKKILKWNT